MRRKANFCLLFYFMMISAISFAAQSEIIAQFRLPQETVRLMNKKSWNKLYEHVVEKLPEEKFAPGRILFKPKGSPNVHLWTFDPKADMAQMLAYVKSLSDVEYCQPDYIYTLDSQEAVLADQDINITRTQDLNVLEQNQSNDPWYNRQAHLGIIGMKNLFETYGPDLRGLIAKGHDPYIHIVDSGGGCEHPDLNRANIILGKDYVDGDDDPCSSSNGMSSHGEFVAAIIGAISNNNHGGAGIMPPNAKLVIWRVFDKDGRAFSSTVGLALSQIVTESIGLGNEIVNMSFGGSREDPFQKLFILTGSAPQELGGKNITFIGASGNNGDSTLNFPAVLKEVMSVGASEFPLVKTGEISRADYSSFGKVDIAAPVGGLDQDNDQNGVADGIFVEGRKYDKDGKNPTPYGAYLFWGTSGATPILSGVAALAINMGIYGPEAIRKVLAETAGDIPPFGHDQETGWGIVRADAAIMSIDDSLPVFGSFSQNSYVCTAALGENTCEVAVNYSFRTSGPRIYLWDNYGNSLRDLGNNGSSGSAAITAVPGDKTHVALLYYPDGGVDSSGDPQVLARTVVTGRALLLLPKGSLFAHNCTLIPGDSSCISTVTYRVVSNGWNVYIWDNVDDSWSNTAISGSGTRTATVKSGSTTYVRLYFCPGNNGVPDNCLGKVDLPTGIDLNANPAPLPVAFLIVNGSTDITVNVGETLNYLWFSTYADSANSSYTSACRSGQWIANTPDFGYVSAVVMPFQTGCTYTITYSVTQSPTNKTTSAAITVRVR